VELVLIGVYYALLRLTRHLFAAVHEVLLL
jgi:hypothetical protein